MVKRLKSTNGKSNGTKSNGTNGVTTTKMGRPSKYQPIFIEQAKKLCKFGATDADLADFFEVNLVTLYRWYCSKPDFRNAIRIPKDEADDRVERSFYQKAIGFWVDTEKLFVLKDEHYDDDGNLIKVSQRVHHEPTREYYPPDTAAGFIWLKNRRPDIWRDKHEVEGTIRNEHVFTFNIFENDLSASMKTIEGKKVPKLERRP